MKKAEKKRSKQKSVPPERTVRRLKGCSGKQLLKVAFELDS